MSELDDDGGGWTVEEFLGYCDKSETDDVWVDDPSNSIRRMPKPVTFMIPLGHTKDFPRPKKIPGDEYYVIDYEVKIIIDGMLMSFEIVIPCSGRFINDGSSEDYVIREQQTYNIAGAWKL